MRILSANTPNIEYRATVKSNITKSKTRKNIYFGGETIKPTLFKNLTGSFDPNFLTEEMFRCRICELPNFVQTERVSRSWCITFPTGKGIPISESKKFHDEMGKVARPYGKRTALDTRPVDLDELCREDKGDGQIYEWYIDSEEAMREFVDLYSKVIKEYRY